MCFLKTQQCFALIYLVVYIYLAPAFCLLSDHLRWLSSFQCSVDVDGECSNSKPQEDSNAMATCRPPYPSRSPLSLSLSLPLLLPLPLPLSSPFPSACSFTGWSNFTAWFRLVISFSVEWWAPLHGSRKLNSTHVNTCDVHTIILIILRSVSLNTKHWRVFTSLFCHLTCTYSMYTSCKSFA